jgi:hypothetical protein
MRDVTRKFAPSTVLPSSLTEEAWMDWSIMDFNYQVEVFAADVQAAKKHGQSVIPNKKSTEQHEEIPPRK